MNDVAQSEKKSKTLIWMKKIEARYHLEGDSAFAFDVVSLELCTENT